MPYSGTDKNASASPQDWSRAGEKSFRKYDCGNGSPLVSNGAAQRYTKGGGSGVDISYTPSDFMTSGFADRSQKLLRAGDRRDEVLLHEIVHALHQMDGKLNCSVGQIGRAHV